MRKKAVFLAHSVFITFVHMPTHKVRTCQNEKRLHKQALFKQEQVLRRSTSPSGGGRSRTAVWNKRAYSRIPSPPFIRIILILDIPTAPLVMHGHRLPDFAQSRRLAFRADGYRGVGVMLKELEALAAFGALVDVERHHTFL